MSRKDRRLYNYVVNTLGLSKELVLEYARDRLDDLITKHIQSKIDSRYIERLILERVTNKVTEGMDTGWYSRESFDEYLRKVVHQIIESKVNAEYRLDVRLIEKGATVIKRKSYKHKNVGAKND
jgi:hypothetical protein